MNPRPNSHGAWLLALAFASAASGTLAAPPPPPDQDITIQALRMNHVPVVRMAPPKPKPKPLPKRVDRTAPDYVAPPASAVTAAAAATANQTLDVAENTAEQAARQRALRATRPPAKEGRGMPNKAYEIDEHPSRLPLNLVDYVSMVRERNNKLLAERLEWQVAEEGVTDARSNFEMEFVTSATHEENTQKNTVQEALQRSSFATFREFNERYDGALEQNLTSGGKIRSGYHLDSLNNNLQTASGVGGLDTFNEFRTFIGSTLTQPLLRNRGKKVARAKISVAEKDRDIAFQSYRREMMRVVADAIFAYVELSAAQMRMQYRDQSVSIARRLLETNRERVKAGMLADTEILEAEAGLAQREAQQRAAAQDVVTATARVRNFISAVPDGWTETSIEATDQLEAEPINTDLASSMMMAERLAPEFVAAKRRAEKEGIKLEYAQNQRMPQLDMRASYGVNGLDTSPDKSFHDAFASDNRNWNVLAEFRVPLDGGLKSKSDLKVAEYHKKEALLQIKNTEVELTNAVDVALKNVDSARSQIEGYRDATQKGEHLLDVELKRLDAGLSTSRQVLQREEDLNRVREERLKALIAFKRAGLELELTRGSLLRRFGMEVTDMVGAPRKARPKKG